MPKPLDFTIQTKADLIRAVQTVGILPAFRNSVPGFSVEENASPRAWFSEEEGFWEWKGPVIREAGCAYGKFFEGKAAFVSLHWFLHLANYRRDGYDLDALYEEGMVPSRDKTLYDLVVAGEPILSKQLKHDGNYRRGGATGFDTSMLHLQSKGYVVISDFVYLRDRFGPPYGWGVAEYSTPERLFGAAFTEEIYRCEPEKSHALLLSHLTVLLPHADPEKLRRFLG